MLFCPDYAKNYAHNPPRPTRQPPEMCNFPERTVTIVSGQLSERPLSITNKMAAKQVHVLCELSLVG